ncbi:peptidylprolyl isomerase [Marinicella sp. S1101]|uniref:peptidylprolyl isomerase n=1 Tax=Marinicella marina TaxID=2996016 RepID=UPI002260F899|nr:peptidylprolyl isomerase [Marinicella marina]MCX7552644.1 peptidylprolyl isomerase [Marinicella marina]MDJ1139520.1 peptidylprolyl isomerase [Marinicella marina]
MIKALFWLILSLQPEQTILEQGSSSVPVSDLDAYVLSLSPESRPGFINDKMQIEKNIITMLNLNIVHDYINEQGLDTHEGFNKIPDLVNQTVDEMADDYDEAFFVKLGLDKSDTLEKLKAFIIKKEYFARMPTYLQSELEKGAIDQLVSEYFMLNLKEWTVPEKRDLSLIKINEQKFTVEELKAILIDLISNDSFDYFSDIAPEISDDDSVKYNQGHLKEFRAVDLDFPFTDEIFEANINSTIPKLFKHEGYFYLIRVNAKIDEVKPKLEDYSDQIKADLLPQIVEKKLQNIINTQAKNKVNMDPEVMAQVFERYNPLLTEE